MTASRTAAGARLSLFDANAMLGPTVARPDPGGLDELRGMMKQYHVDAALACHSYAWHHHAATGNALLLREIGDDASVRPCWVAIPPVLGEMPGFQTWLAEAAAASVAAFRIYPHDHGYDVLGVDADPMFAMLGARGWPVLVDAAQASWAELEELARRHPAIPLVVTGTGYRTLRLIAGALERHDTVHVDLSYLGSHQALEWLVSRFGVGRVLFGTGFPLRDPADAVTRLMWSGLDDSAVAAVGGGNLRRLLGPGESR